MTSQISKNKRCLECGEPLVGRIDKKFCDDQCRSAYNNRKFNRDHTFIRKVNRILKKNWKILQSLNPDGKIILNKNELINLGFNFNYFTYSAKTRKGKIYYFCYDQGFYIKDNKQLLLIKSNCKDNFDHRF